MKLFLKDLNPKRGNPLKEAMPSCGVFCEVEFASLIDPITDKILTGKVKSGDTGYF